MAAIIGDDPCGWRSQREAGLKKLVPEPVDPSAVCKNVRKDQETTSPSLHLATLNGQSQRAASDSLIADADPGQPSATLAPSGHENDMSIMENNEPKEINEPKETASGQGLEPEVQRQIGRVLKQVYDEVAKAPIPREFLDLLDQLENRDKSS